MNKVREKISFFSRHQFGLAIFASIFLFVFASFGLVAANGESVSPTDSRLVNVYIDGREEIVPTRANTVGEFVTKLPVTIGPADIVEPARETLIDSDNFRVRILRAEPTTIVDGDKSTSLLSPYEDPRSAVEKAGFELFPEDIVEQQYPGDPQTSRILGRKLVITRAKLLAITVYGSPVQHRTTRTTVSEVLGEMNIVPAADDTVSPALDTRVSDTSFINISRFGKQVVNIEEIVEQPVEYITDKNLPFGSTETREAGSAGKRLVTYELTLENGSEVSRQKIQEAVVAQPVKKVIARGESISIPVDKQSIMAAAGIAQSDFGYVDYIISREGSWCPTKWQGQWGICPSYYQEKFPGAETDPSLGYGICQSTPAIKMATAGSDWRTNVVTQLKWCSGYAQGRYGGWKGAYEAWLVKHWW